jgi:hypothetical protein
MENDLQNRLEVIEFALAYSVTAAGNSEALSIGLNRLAQTKPALQEAAESMLGQLRAVSHLPGQDRERHEYRKLGFNMP